MVSILLFYPKIVSDLHGHLTTFGTIFWISLPGSSDDDAAPVEKRAPVGRRAAAASKAKYNYSSGSDEELF